MNNYILAFGLSFILSLILTKIVVNFTKKRKLAILEVRDRDIHSKPTPRLGGVAIFISFLLVIIGYLFVFPDKIDFDVKNIGFIDKNILGMILGSIIIVGAGIYDDLKGLSPWKKLAWQIIAAIIIVFFGIKIHWFTNPLGGLNIELGFWTNIIVPIWILILVNSINWIDSIDGLASGISFIGAIILFILSIGLIFKDPNQSVTALLAIILAGSILGFLPFNFHPAKIFLGDSGSMFLGFMLAVLAVISGAKVATAILVLGIPILDAIWVIIRRIINHQPVWKADKFHLAHRFMLAGFNQRQIVILLYIVSLLFGIIALQSNAEKKIIAGLILVGVLVIIGVVLQIKSRKLKKL